MGELASRDLAIITWVDGISYCSCDRTYNFINGLFIFSRLHWTGGYYVHKIVLICLFRGLSIIQIQIILPQLFIVIKLKLDLDYTRINYMIYPSFKSSYYPKYDENS